MSAKFAKFSQYLDDIESPVIQHLVDDFGPDVVFCQERSFSLDDEMLKKIFNSLNESFFNLAIPDIPVKCMPYIEIKNELLKRKIKKAKKIENGFYGVFNVLVANDDLTIVKNASEIILRNDIIMMNTDMTCRQTFIFLVACVCHEMIHAYMRFNGEYAQLIVDNINDLENMDTHTSDGFKKIMNQANKMRINVIDKITKPDPILNANAYSLLTTGKTIYESRKEKLENDGYLELGDLILYDNGRKAAILCID